jgi:hypothetical protein
MSREGISGFKWVLLMIGVPVAWVIVCNVLLSSAHIYIDPTPSISSVITGASIFTIISGAILFGTPFVLIYLRGVDIFESWIGGMLTAIVYPVLVYVYNYLKFSATLGIVNKVVGVTSDKQIDQDSASTLLNNISNDMATMGTYSTIFKVVVLIFVLFLIFCPSGGLSRDYSKAKSYNKRTSRW